MTDVAELHDRSPAVVLRERAQERLLQSINELLSPWQRDHAAAPSDIPPPPDPTLGINAFWWGAVAVTPGAVDVTPLPTEADPLGRLATPFPKGAERLRWLCERIGALRLFLLREEVGRLGNLLASGEVRLTGIRTPVIKHGDARVDVPIAVLRARNWRFCANDVLELDNATVTFTNLLFVATPKDHRAALEQEVTRWMQQHGEPPTRDQMVQALRDRFPIAATKQLYAELPIRLKRNRGDSARTLHRRGRPSTSPR